MKVEVLSCSSILFWFLGHPEVYIILLPAMGMVSEVYEYKFAETDLWLYGDGGFAVRYYHPCLPGLGAPYVCNRSESFPGICIRVAYPADRGSFSYQSIQLANYPLERQYPVYTGNVVRDWFCESCSSRVV